MDEISHLLRTPALTTSTSSDYKKHDMCCGVKPKY